jgi:hypothetical protein
MSTHSSIGIKNSDGSVEMIYCHSDGYPTHQLPILEKFYTTENKVRELLALGDISYLGGDINDVIAYHRDRGEDLITAIKYPSLKIARENAYEYMYVFEDNCWKSWNN